MVSDLEIPCREYWGNDVFDYLSSFCCGRRGKMTEYPNKRELWERGGWRAEKADFISDFWFAFFIFRNTIFCGCSIVISFTTTPEKFYLFLILDRSSRIWSCGWQLKLIEPFILMFTNVNADLLHWFLYYSVFIGLFRRGNKEMINPSALFEGFKCV